MLVYKDLKNIKEDYIIITKSNVENLGKKTMKKVYEILNTDWSDLFIEEVNKKIKKEKDKLDKYLINSIFLKDKKKVKYFHFEFKTDKNEDEIYDEIYDEINYNLKKCYLEKIKNKIENESLDIDLIFEALSKIELIWEIDEDTYCERKAFLNIYTVFYHQYKELEY